MNKKDNKDKLIKDKNFHLKYFIRAVSTYYKSYSHKPHLGALPYDLHTNDPEKLKERLRACNRELKNAQSELKDAREMDKMMEDNIKEIEENEKVLKDEIKNMEEQNAQISETIHKVYDHFEDVTMMTENDGWEIKKLYDKWKENQSGYDISSIDEKMKYFIDDISLQGYYPDGYRTEINNLVDEFYSYGDRLAWDNKTDDFPELNEQLRNRMLEYRDKYDISKNTPLTQELNRIEKEGNLSDKWDMVEQRNNKEIKKRNEIIEKENERKEEIKERQKENRREMGKLETKVNDFENHREKIKDKLGD